MSDADIPSLETLYNCAEILSQKNVIYIKNCDKFDTILKGVKGNAHSKKLTSTFIARFFHYFPSRISKALDAILDLCEDDDVSIRKQAIKYLPLLCRERKEVLPKIADVLTQLLLTEDSEELFIIRNSLVSLFKKEPKGTLIGLFSQIKNGGNEIREKAIEFLCSKCIFENEKGFLDKMTESILITEIKGVVLRDCRPKEFHRLLSLLNSTSLLQSTSGMSQCAELMSKIAELDKPLDPTNKNNVERFLFLAEKSSIYFSSRVPSTAFFQYLCLQILPSIHLFINDELRVFKLLGVFAQYTSFVSQGPLIVSNVLDTLISILPHPHHEQRNIEGYDQFTILEALLYTLCVLGRQSPSHLTNTPELYKDFKIRLQNLAKINNMTLQESKTFQNLPETPLNAPKKQLYYSSKNIHQLIRNLFHTPPLYNTSISLSWLSKDQKSIEVGVKRQNITFTSNSPKKMEFTRERKKGLYVPPNGKFSSNLKEYYKKRQFKSRGRGRKSPF